MTRSIQQLPNSQYTANVVEVPTQTGFSAGDLVYYNNGDYKIQSNLTPPSTVSYPIAQTYPTFGGAVGALGQSAFSATQAQGAIGSSGGSFGSWSANLIAQFTAGTGTSGAFTVTVTTATNIANGQLVTGVGIGAGAVVTNVSGTTITLSVANSGTVSGNLSFLTGNTVQVYMNWTSTINTWFRIVNSSTNAVVYGPTKISTQAGNYGAIQCTALTGGGFAVAYQDSNANIYISVWSNTGTVVTASFADALPSGTQNYYNQCQMTSLANGGFAISTCNTSNVVYFKIYTATAGATTSFTSIATNIASYTNTISIASRSDSSIIVGYNSASTTFSYYLYNSSGGSITSGTITDISANSVGPDICCLADGSTYVISLFALTTSPNNYTPVFYLLPTGNTLGSVINPIPQTNYYDYKVNNLNFFPTIKMLPQTAGGLFVVFANNLGCPYYFFANSSLTTFYPGATTSGNVIPSIVPNAWIYQGGSTTSNPKFSVIENNGVITVYIPQIYNPANPVNMESFTVNETTYLTPYNNTVAPISQNTITAATGTYTQSLSSPTSIKYTSNTNATTLYNQQAGVITSPTALTSVATYGTHSCTLTNGTILLAYTTGASPPTGISIAVFNANGVYQQTLVVNVTNYPLFNSTVLYNCSVRICAMQGGKFCVSWTSSVNSDTQTVVAAIYNSSLALSVGPVVILNASNTSGSYYPASDVYGYDLIGLSTDQLIFVYTNLANNYFSYQAYNNSLTTVGSQVAINSTYGSCPKLTANSWGGFYVCTQIGGAAETIYGYAPTPGSTTAWTQMGSGGFGGNTTNGSVTQGLRPFYSLCNGIVAVCPSGSNTTPQLNFFDHRADASAPTYYDFTTAYPIIGGVTANYGANGLGPTGAGTITLATWTTTSRLVVYGFPMGAQGGGGGYNITNNAQSYPSTNQVVITSTINTVYGCMNVTACSGFSSFISWRDTNGYLTYAVVNTLPYQYYLSITSGSSVSNPVSIYPNNTTTSSTIPNTVLSGVAATTASAGSTGQVVINGLAQLNSNYPATGTGAFDSTGQAIDGVRGTYNGRNINLQGNS